jgi:hypothetical protein
MALDFPSNPSDGEVFGSYIWSASKGVWQSREESAAPAVVSPVPPTTPTTGDIWVDSSDGISYVYYDDGSSGQWIEMISSGVVSFASKADIDSPSFTGTVVLPANTSIGNVSGAELAHLDGLTSSAQTQINSKAAIAGQAFTGNITVPNIGINGGSTSSGFPLEMIGRAKIRAGSSTTSGIWMDNAAGNGQIFWGNLGLGAAASDGTGIWHGGWKFWTTQTLTSFENDIESIRWRGRFDRAWDNYPSITIFNTTDKGPQGEFRIHGYPGANGGDYSIGTRSDGGFITGSDARRKVNIEQIPDALEKINSISGKVFNIINSEGEIETELSSEETGKKFGFIAQDVIDVIPEAVKYYPEADEENENGYASAYSIDYGSLVPLLIQGINELSEKVKELEDRLNGS